MTPAFVSSAGYHGTAEQAASLASASGWPPPWPAVSPAGTYPSPLQPRSVRATRPIGTASAMITPTA